MVEIVPFRLKLSGGIADRHQFQGYDGYMSLAGFAWTLGLVANYVETGKIRRKGNFVGRRAVRAVAPVAGSVLADFTVWIQQNPADVLKLSGAALGTASALFFTDLLRRVIARNLGQEVVPESSLLAQLIERREGDIEALVAGAEPAIRRAHDVIGSGADNVQIVGGHNIINNFDVKTKEYVNLNIEDTSVSRGEFRVSSFNVNSGYGSIFDIEIGRTIPISMSKEVLEETRSIFTWGLDQYANRKLGTIIITYTRILAMDDTPKQYVVLSARKVTHDDAA